MSSFEKKFGKYAIKNLPLILIACYMLGYVLQLAETAMRVPILSYLYLSPSNIIFKLQIWRLFTWILIPPDRFNILTLIVLYFYYSIGTSLENVWGRYKFNLYILSGFIFTVVGAFVLFGIAILTGMPLYVNSFNTFYVNMSIFLAFAATFPEAQVFLLMIIPIRVKYLGIIYGAMLVYEVLGCVATGNITQGMVIVVSLLNFLIFFLTQRRNFRSRVRAVKRQYEFKRQMSQTERDMGLDKRNREEPVRESKKPGITRHKCAVCGKTEEENDNLNFRFCSKCNGNYEYCEEHLFTHIHVK